MNIDNYRGFNVSLYICGLTTTSSLNIILGVMDTSLNSVQQQEVEVKQFQNFLQYYNKLTELCFTDCIHDFTNRKISSNENNCAIHCSEKFLKVMQRVGVRLQEVQVMQNEGLLGAPEPPK